MKNPRAILSLCLATVLTACVTQSKVEDWNRSHPVESAAYCANNYPCKPQDSTTTEQTDSIAFNLALENLLQKATGLSSLNDSLLQVIESRDSACMRYVPVILELQRRFTALRDSFKRLPPKIVYRTTTRTEIDDAAVKAAEGKAAAKEKENAVLQDRLEAAQKKLNGWKIFGIGCGVGLLLMLLTLILLKRK